ncbi:Thymidylate kinase [Dirofilaria immitis]
MEKNSLFITASTTAATTTTTTTITAEHKSSVSVPMKNEYISDKYDNTKFSYDNCDAEVMNRSKHKYRSTNREYGKKVAKKAVRWPVKDVYEIKSEAIILAVEQLPCLWNLSCEDYRNRSKRREGWSTVSRMLIRDFENKDVAERQSIEKEIQNKWKNIRDCYVRDMRRKNGETVKSRGKRTREYIHAGLLAFLNSSYVTKSSSVQSSKSGSENTYDFILDTVVKPFLDHNAEINCDWIKQETLEEKLGIILEERSLEHDEDSAFFSTLLPTIRNLEPKQKIEFRLEVLQALRQIAIKQSSPPLILQTENLGTDFNASFSRKFSSNSSIFSKNEGSGTCSGISGTDSFAMQFQAAEDFIMSLRDMQREYSSSSRSSLSSLPHLSIDTQ